MDNKKVQNTLNQFLDTRYSTKQKNNMEQEICDMQTGECYILRSKDGIVERINKKFITEDGRQLLQD